MSKIFEKLRLHADEFELILSDRATRTTDENNYAWNNQVYASSAVRRAHLDIIDVTETKNLYMMHLCVFPHVYDTAPIYGFDIIAGPNKVTGAFFDFSPIGDTAHPLCQWFQKLVEPTQWAKTRQLPPWAMNIFSKHMVAAGNINTDEELNAMLYLSKTALTYYMDNVKTFRPAMPHDQMIAKFNFTDQQNYYCQQQKQNPHTPRVLKSLGFSEETAEKFIHTELFPEIVK